MLMEKVARRGEEKKRENDFRKRFFGLTKQHFKAS
jgi:hypothetical protein